MSAIRLSVAARQDGATDGQVPIWNNSLGKWTYGSPVPATHTHAESDVTGLVTDLAAALPKALVDAKGDLLVGTADNIVARLPVGTDGFVLTADSTQTAGLKWAASTGGGGGGGGGGNGLLGMVNYAPSSLTQPAFTSTASTGTNVDTTNLAVTFTAPSSGRAIVRLSANAHAASGGQLAWWQLMNASGGAYMTGSAVEIQLKTTTDRYTTECLLTGLTAGTSYTLYWNIQLATAGTVTFDIQNNNFPAVMEVWDGTIGGSTGTGTGSSGLLAIASYAASVDNATYSTSSTTNVDVDATNLKVTFTAPASGRVIVRLGGHVYLSAGSGSAIYCLRDASGDVAGTNRVVQSALPGQYLSVPILVTGLTGGASYTWKWGWHANPGSSPTIQIATGPTNYGPAIMEVWDATIGGSSSGVTSSSSVSGRANRSTTQSIANNTNTAVSFDGTDFDTNTFWASGTPTRLTVPAGQSGKYIVVGGADWDNASTSGVRSMFLQKNGTTRLAESIMTAPSTHAPQQVVDVQPLVAGDYVELMVYQNSGSSLLVNVAEFRPFLSLVRVDVVSSSASSGSATYARVKQTTSAGQSIPYGTWTKVLLDVADVDPNNLFDNTNDRLTIGQTGVYSLEGAVVFAANTTGIRYVGLFKNGSATNPLGEAVVNATASDTAVVPAVSGPVSLVAGDYVELWAFHTVTGGLTITTHDSLGSWLGLRRLDGGNSNVTTLARVRAHLTSNVAVADGTTVQLTGWAEDDDPYNLFASSAFTATTAGSYLVHYVVNYAASTTGDRIIFVYVNGAATFSAAQQAVTVSGHGTIVLFSRVLRLNAGDVLTFYAYQSSGSTLNVTGSAAPYQTVIDITQLPDTSGGGSSSGSGASFLTTASGSAAAWVTTTSTTSTDLDATNLKVTFTAPVSGRVLVTLDALGYGASGASGLVWSLRSGGADVAGTPTVVSENGSSTAFIRQQARILVTGLTAGTSYTWTWGIAATAATTVGTYNGGTIYPATMIVQDATIGTSSGSSSVSASSLLASVTDTTTNAWVTASSTTLVDLDATNAKVTFTAPVSGRVVVRLSATGYGSSAGSSGLLWTVRDATSGTVYGSQSVSGQGSSTSWTRCSAEIPIAGLTAGQVYTVKWSVSTDIGTGTVGTWGGNATNQAVMEIYDGTLGVSGGADTAWTAPTLVNSWVNANPTTYSPAGYRKDGTGFVHLRGLITGGSSSTVAFTLPAGYRPAYNAQFACIYWNGSAFATMQVQVGSNGQVNVSVGVSGTGNVSIDGITFLAEA